ncbi:MAG: hypothetical protein LBE76_00590, partial [Nitrososphaerota archaeon]|nr:hypothetical protein [Nitrososphaerota archaeon]
MKLNLLNDLSNGYLKNSQSVEEHALFQEKNYKFPGFSSQSRTIRSYPRNLGGNLLGYIGEVDSLFLGRNP